MLYYTSLVKAIMDKNYNYARGIDSFKKGRVKYEDLENEYSILGVNLMERPIDFDYDYLLKMSKSALEDEKYFI